MSYTSITPRELYSRIEQREKPRVVDVRTPIEFREIHATVARNCPLDSISPAKIFESGSIDSEEPVYVICKSGNRSKMACEKLVTAGVKVINVEGGTAAWADAGLPVVRGKKAISLERQVRICAGALVVLGVALTVIFNSLWFLIISGFVGCGLIFAGVTDTCGMGMMLSKMPWNQLPKAERCQAPSSSDSASPSCNA